MSGSLVCWNCGASLEDVPLPISRHAYCDSCREVLHCCRMCRHYLPDKRPYCDHDLADPPEVKENANFCDYFKPANRFDNTRSGRTDNARSQLDALFDGDDGETQDQAGDDELKNRLDDLFDD